MASTPILKPKKGKFHPGRILLYLGVLLLLLIPTYIAAATYTAQKNAPQTDIHTVYDSMTLVGPTAYEQYASTKENTTLFSTFTTLCQQGDEVVFIPDRYYDGKFVATMSAKDTTDVYTFYFSREETTCFYSTPAGKIFRTDHALIPEFLNGTYAFELYAASTLPTLSTAATDEVIPSSVSWSYRTASGTFVERTQITVSNTLRTYPIANDIAFYFSVQPTSHEILIRRDGVLLYSGTSDGISLPLQDGEILDFEVRAIFSPDSAQDYYGELVYRFRMQVVEAAHFIPNKTQLFEGDILLLYCENVKNVEKLVVTATPALDAEPVIFRRDDAVYAAIPVSTVGTKHLQVTYGTVSGAFDFTVLPHTSTVHTVDAEHLRGDWSALLTTTLPNLIAQRGAQTDSGLTPRTITSLPTQRIFGYGDVLNVEGTDLSELTLPFQLYRNTGAVHALAAGRVRFVGNDPLLGNYVILDHGCGVYTWYAGLSETRVVAGDILAVGDTLGLSSTTLYHEESVLIMATLGRSAISLEKLCDAPSAIPE